MATVTFAYFNPYGDEEITISSDINADLNDIENVNAYAHLLTKLKQPYLVSFKNNNQKSFHFYLDPLAVETQKSAEEKLQSLQANLITLKGKNFGLTKLKAFLGNENCKKNVAEVKKAEGILRYYHLFAHGAKEPEGQKWVLTHGGWANMEENSAVARKHYKQWTLEAA